ncbi:hypothetical protein MTO96_003509, partial [Rhipicephalus appendiculatus]
MLLVHATDNHDMEADAENEREAGAAKQGLEAKVHGEGKPEEAEHGEQLDEGGVDHSGNSDEAGGEAEVDEVNAAEVLTTAVTEDENREAETILLVYAADNQVLEADIDNEHQAAAAKEKATFAMAAATETTAAAMDKGAVKNSRLAAVSTPQAKTAWPVRPSAAKSASVAVEAKNDTLA